MTKATTTSADSAALTLDDLIDIVSNGGFAEKIALERSGVSIQALKQLAGCIGWTPSQLRAAIGSADRIRFARNSTRVRGAPCLRCIELVRTRQLVHELHDGTVDASFNVDLWLGRWLLRPGRAFAGNPPIEWMDTPSGADYIRYVIRALVAGVYI
jgi:hypothetical protein